jgi:4-amino-4-deoxy-L-arabinose transferase-like glycosyltransferase
LTHRLTSLAAPPERPLPLWILYPLFVVGIYLSHESLLRLPYFWDEAGYYIPATLDFFHTGSLIPHSTLTNAHPPLPSILLAAWWRVAGLSINGTRTFLCMIAAAALLGVFRLGRLLGGNAVAVTVTALTALYPIWFVQSTLAHADLFAATFTLWALSFYFERRHPLAIAILFSLAALAKETAIVTPLALALWELRPAPIARAFKLPLALIFPVIPLAAWYAYHHHVTGFTFGNPEFLRYNATANLTPARILLSLWHRWVHLFFHMDMFVPVVCALACLPMPKRPGETPPALLPLNLQTIVLILAANAIAFSILGGALLTRYLLPMYPLILLVCAAVWQQRFRRWVWLAIVSGVAFLLALTVNPPYSFAPEDNLTYRDFIQLHQRAINLLAHHFPHATVLTAWPASAELSHPELGYVRKPIANIAIDNFSLPEIQKAAAEPGDYDTALVFSTKWVPPAGAFSLTRPTESTDTRYFDFHRDLTPAEIAVQLHGEVVWESHSHGEWAAILRFPRAAEAGLREPPLLW